VSSRGGLGNCKARTPRDKGGSRYSADRIFVSLFQRSLGPYRRPLPYLQERASAGQSNWKVRTDRGGHSWMLTRFMHKVDVLSLYDWTSRRKTCPEGIGVATLAGWLSDCRTWLVDGVRLTAGFGQGPSGTTVGRGAKGVLGTTAPSADGAAIGSWKGV